MQREWASRIWTLCRPLDRQCQVRCASSVSKPKQQPCLQVTKNVEKAAATIAQQVSPPKSKGKSDTLPFLQNTVSRLRAQHASKPPERSQEKKKAVLDAYAASFWSRNAAIDETAIPVSTSRGRNGTKLWHLPPVIYRGDTNILELPDGRKLGFAIFGRLDPKREMIPLVAETGTPGTRLDYHSYTDWSFQIFFPVISIDRPGMGHSTYIRNYKPVDYARDVLYLISCLRS
ncbi:hypothetical protein BU23DRAFT_597106 [Bimuria novae-zelandiae CBS 107.79]|uniref:Alpha/beta-hydrolase n=1 Tax=Bimuria novae-zelandiae CBS 107.79 TaxID=1447943 RepID=A0A6A5VGR8_9PLEO|nr:hypothetical protein BU23DRAFT_597106 [Bimuria novae-zelandiae CBS 107.79]